MSFFPSLGGCREFFFQIFQPPPPSKVKWFASYVTSVGKENVCAPESNPSPSVHRSEAPRYLAAGGFVATWVLFPSFISSYC